jgi:site-specific recombinase XerD
MHLLEAGRGIESVADRLGHKKRPNTRIYVQITAPLGDLLFRELEPPKSVRVSMRTLAF